ncbi:MAG: hypothetical protein K2G09_00040 [Paramuribaculum sp.]|nr:hypothetical protein [Paramuribaculum sp.]
MPLSASSESTVWFVLNYIGVNSRDSAQKAVDKYNSLTQSALELFAPTYVVKEEKDGDIKFRTLNLTFHYTFVRGTFEQVKQFCAQPNGFSFMIDHGNTERYAMIDDRKMVAFKNIAKAYQNCLPYYSIDEIDLQNGDLVEVVRGDFPGLIGTYMPKSKSSSGNIILEIYNNVGTVAFNVKATDVRVLEFSKNSTRANDQIDAFVPHLLSALRLFDSDQAIPSNLSAKLAAFCGRMEITTLTNRKLDARLQILLYAANYVIGNTTHAAIHLGKFEKLKNSVTNQWTQALINLIFGVITGDKDILAPSVDTVTAVSTPSKAQQMIAEEYRHYLSAQK